MRDKYRILEALGITIIPVATINGDAVLVDGHPVALIRPDLTDDEHDHVVDWLLARVCPPERH